MLKRLEQRAALSAAIFCMSIFGTSTPAKAASHLPSINITPLAVFETSENVHPAPFVGPLNGDVTVNGSITFPLFNATSVSYDHYTNGLFENTLPRVILGGSFVNTPLEYRDVLDTVRLDASPLKGVGAELGTTYRHRKCCPGDTDPTNTTPQFFHDNYLALSYTSPAFKALNGTRFVYGVTGHESPHNSENAVTAAASAAVGLPKRRTQYGISQALTAAIPIDAEHGFSFAGTYTWGAFNYFSNLVYPLYYGIWILHVQKVVTKNATFFADIDNFVQRPQGYPFGPIGNGGVNGASLNLGVNLHLAP